MTDYGTCGLCSQEEESTLHALRDCPSSYKVWKDMGVQNLFPEYFKVSAHDWWKNNINLDNKVLWDSAWKIVFGVTCWLLWKWRNCHVFKDVERIPFDKCNTIKALVEECKWSWSPSLIRRIPHSIVHRVSWTRPHEGWIKINVDGARN